MSGTSSRGNRRDSDREPHTIYHALRLADDLPGEVREPLPPAAQELYLEAYNTAHAEYSDPETDTDESFAELARADAWDAAEREYEEVDGEYVQNGGGDMQYS